MHEEEQLNKYDKEEKQFKDISKDGSNNALKSILKTENIK